MLKFFTFFTFLSLTHILFGQNQIERLNLEADLGKWSDNYTGHTHSGLFEGVIYLPKFAPRIGGTHLYFKGSHWLKGEIKFRGYVYKDIDLQYDVYSDILVVLNRAAFPTLSIMLPQSQIEYFILENSKFKYFSEEDAPSLGAGFYEMLFNGTRVSAVVKRMKFRDNKGTIVEFQDKAISYKETDKYYLNFDGNIIFFGVKKNFTNCSKNKNLSLKNL